MLPGASAARTRRHSPSAVSSDVFRRGSCRSDHTPDRQVRSVVKRTGAAMPAALFPGLPLPEKAAGMGYCRHEKDLPALRLYDRNHFSHLRRGSEAGRNALDSKSSYRLIAGTWVRIPPSPPFMPCLAPPDARNEALVFSRAGGPAFQEGRSAFLLGAFLPFRQRPSFSGASSSAILCRAA